MSAERRVVATFDIAVVGGQVQRRPTLAGEIHIGARSMRNFAIW
jgi:hypothetical protein